MHTPWRYCEYDLREVGQTYIYIYTYVPFKSVHIQTWWKMDMKLSENHGTTVFSTQWLIMFTIFSWQFSATPTGYEEREAFFSPHESDQPKIK